jgi:phosphodiesterase/alkaline phosphatase D-like protein
VAIRRISLLGFLLALVALVGAAPASAANPTAVTLPVLATSNISATLNGTVIPPLLGTMPALSDCHFDYGPSQSYSSIAPCASIPASGGVLPAGVSADITGLSPATTYHYRLSVTVAGAGGATVTGSDLTFQTTPGSGTPPTAKTGAANPVGATTATLNATVNLKGGTLSSCQFEYGAGSTYTATTACSPTPSGSSDVAVTANLTGLTPGTVYHFQITLATSGGAAQGGDNTFTTHTPVAVTEPAIPVGLTTATINAAVNPEGFTVTDCHFQWGTGAAYGSIAQCATTPSGSTLQAASASLTGLTPATTYHFRIVMTTSFGTAMGGDATFTTAATGPYAAPPIGATEPATHISSSAATLNAAVNPQGLPVADCHFQWGTSAKYGSIARCARTPTGSTLQAAGARLAGLHAATTYHFRIVMTTAGGTLTGGDRTFKTLAAAVKKVKLKKPGVRITKAVINRARHTAGFRFTYRGSKATSYQCSIALFENGKQVARSRFTSCHSPALYTFRASGTFIFYVRGHNRAGYGKPATYKFRF